MLFHAEKGVGVGGAGGVRAAGSECATQQLKHHKGKLKRSLHRNHKSIGMRQTEVWVFPIRKPKAPTIPLQWHVSPVQYRRPADVP